MINSCLLGSPIGNILNIYSPVHVTASDQKGLGSIWKPIDGVNGKAEEESWISLPSSQSWWRMELTHKSTIFSVVIHIPSFHGKPNGYRRGKLTAMTGLAVYIGDSPVGNGSKNTMCGQPWIAQMNTVISFKCTTPSYGKYLYVAGADKSKTELYLSEIVVFGCKGDHIRLCLEFVLSICNLALLFRAKGTNFK